MIFTENWRLILAAKEFSRELRKNATESEKLLWEAIRNRKFLGKKFLRQHPIFFEHNGKQTFFIADFYCHEGRLALEIEGKIHDYQKEYDELRTYAINTLGIKVVRCKNEEIRTNLARVLERLNKIMTDSS